MRNPASCPHRAEADSSRSQAAWRRLSRLGALEIQLGARDAAAGLPTPGAMTTSRGALYASMTRAQSALKIACANPVAPPAPFISYSPRRARTSNADARADVRSAASFAQRYGPTMMRPQAACIADPRSARR